MILNQVEFAKRARADYPNAAVDFDDLLSAIPIYSYSSLSHIHYQLGLIKRFHPWFCFDDKWSSFLDLDVQKIWEDDKSIPDAYTVANIPVEKALRWAWIGFDKRSRELSLVLIWCCMHWKQSNAKETAKLASLVRAIQKPTHPLHDACRTAFLSINSMNTFKESVGSMHVSHVPGLRKLWDLHVIPALKGKESS